MVNRQSRDPGQIRRLEVTGRVSGEVPSFAVDTGAAARALADVAGGLSARLGKMAGEAAAREGELAGLDAGARSGAAYLQMQAAQAAAAGKAVAPGGAAQLIREEEGFRETPYWDVNAWRIGYGSDTVTLADGTVQRVTQGMKITKTDAERDLARRIGEFAGGADKATGGLFAKLPDNVRTGLTSVVYNYGSLPKSVVAAVRTGDRAAIANAVRSLSSNPKRRAREAAIIANAAFAPSGVSAETTAATKPANTPVVPTLPTTPLALRRDGTIYSEAYNRAATNAYSWRLQAGLEAEIAQAAIEHPDDPGALAGALAKVQDKFARDPNLAEPELREAFQKRFAERSQAYMLDAQAKAEAKMREQETSAAFEGIAAQRLGIERQAVTLGANAKGDEIISREVEKAGAAIDGAVRSGALTPAQGAKQKQELTETAATGRVRGVYEALPSAGEKEQFAIGLLDDWKNGKGPLAKLPYDAVKALSDTLFNDARDLSGRLTTAQKVEGSKLERLIADDITAISATGKGLKADSGLTADRVGELLGPQALEAWQAKRSLATRTWQATSGMETQSPAELASRIALLDKAVKDGGPGATEAAIALSAAREKAAAVLKERETDPLGQANRAGAIELKAIDFSSPENLTASLAKRRADGDAVARLGGGKATYFQPSERAYLARVMSENPAYFPDFALALTSTFGDQAAVALGELSDDAPVMAHAAGITLATGDNSVATDIAQALAAKQQGLWKTKIALPTQRKIVTAAGEMIGTSLAFVPKVKASTLAAATLLFEQDANRLGFDIDDVGEAGSAARASLERAIDRALGGSTVAGVKLGGIGEVNGTPIVVPTDMAAERPQQLLESLSDAELAALPPIRSANGVPVEAWQLRQAHLVAFADGRYRVTLGDPDGPDPQRVLDQDGHDWILDIHALDALRGRRIEAVPLGISTRGNFR